jgi:hypothetical protein
LFSGLALTIGIFGFKNMTDSPENQEITREVSDLKQVQIHLSGWEVYSLIAAVQSLKARNPKFIKIMTTAEVAARKLHQEFLRCPNTYTLLDQGWDLTKLDLPSKKNDSNT